MSRYSSRTGPTSESLSTLASLSHAERIQKIEERISGLEIGQAVSSARLDRVEEATSLLQQGQETIKVELEGQVATLREQYRTLSSEVDRWSVARLAFISLVSIGAIYYVLSVWYLLFNKPA